MSGTPVSTAAASPSGAAPREKAPARKSLSAMRSKTKASASREAQALRGGDLGGAGRRADADGGRGGHERVRAALLPLGAAGLGGPGAGCEPRPQGKGGSERHQIARLEKDSPACGRTAPGSRRWCGLRNGRLAWRRLRGRHRRAAMVGLRVRPASPSLSPAASRPPRRALRPPARRNASGVRSPGRWSRRPPCRHHARKVKSRPIRLRRMRPTWYNGVSQAVHRQMRKWHVPCPPCRRPDSRRRMTMARRGRKPTGTNLLERLQGSERAKTRLKGILETLSAGALSHVTTHSPDTRWRWTLG